MASKKPAPGQLDLFLDTGPIALANDAIHALERRDAARAATHLRRLRREEPSYPTLNALETLCRAIEDRPLPASAPDEIAGVVHWLETEIRPAAKAVMGKEAAQFLAPFWRDLADTARDQPYDPDFPQSFCAGLYLRCGNPGAAAKAAEAIPGADTHPDALHWLAVARHGLGGLEACRPVLASLALWAPLRLAAAITETGDTFLRRDWKRFRQACDWLDPDDETAPAWFPAWSLIEHRGMPIAAIPSSLPATDAAEAYVLMARLNALEQEGYTAELIEARSQLRELNPALFDLYMDRHKDGQP